MWLGGDVSMTFLGLGHEVMLNWNETVISWSSMSALQYKDHKAYCSTLQI